VKSDYVKGVLTYFVEHKETGERKGEFDCQLWAEEFADALNKQEEEKNDQRSNEANNSQD
jgi:hypothetical protein